MIALHLATARGRRGCLVCGTHRGRVASAAVSARRHVARAILDARPLAARPLRYRAGLTLAALVVHPIRHRALLDLARRPPRLRQEDR